MHSGETKDPACNIFDICIDPPMNAKVFAPLGLDALAERYINSSSSISNRDSCATKRAVGSYGEKTDKDIKKVPISIPFDERTDDAMIPDSILSEEMFITGNRNIRRQKKSLEIEPLKHEYFKNETILFKIPDHITSCEEWVRLQMSLIWQRLEAELGARLSLQLDNHCLRVSGTYNDSCTVCYFDAQVWKAEFGI